MSSALCFSGPCLQAIPDELESWVSVPRTPQRWVQDDLSSEAANMRNLDLIHAGMVRLSILLSVCLSVCSMLCESYVNSSVETKDGDVGADLPSRIREGESARVHTSCARGRGQVHLLLQGLPLRQTCVPLLSLSFFLFVCVCLRIRCSLLISEQPFSAHELPRTNFG